MVCLGQDRHFVACLCGLILLLLVCLQSTQGRTTINGNNRIEVTDEAERKNDHTSVQHFGEITGIKLRPGEAQKPGLESARPALYNILLNSAVARDTIRAIESYLQQEEQRLQRDIEHIQHTLSTIARFYDEALSRGKRRAKAAQPDVELRNFGKTVSTQQVDTKSDYSNYQLDGKENGDDGIIVEGEHPVNDYRQKIAMNFVRSEDGETTINLNYETLERSGRYRRETADTDDINYLFLYILSAILLILAISGLAYLSVYLCRKYHVCTKCYNNAEEPLKLRSSWGRLSRVPRFVVTNTDGYRRSVIDHRKLSAPSCIPFRPNTHELRGVATGHLGKSNSYPNLNQESLEKRRSAWSHITLSSSENPTRRVRTRSLSESDCELIPLTQPAEERVLLSKAQRRHRTYLAKIKKQPPVLYTKNPVENDSGDSGFSSPTSSGSRRSARQARRGYYYGVHHNGPRPAGSGPHTPSFLDHSGAYIVGRSTASLGSVVSHGSSVVSSQATTIPGLIEYA